MSCGPFTTSPVMSLPTVIMNSQPTDLAKSIWKIIAGQTTGNNVIVHVPLSGVFDELAINEKDWVLQSFSLLINAPSVFTVLSDIDRVVLHPFGQGPLLGQAIDYMLQDDNAELNGTIMDKIRRPPNAFILYRKARHQRVKDHNPGIHNNQISVILGQQWNRESTEIRNHYLALAEQARLEHLQQYPDYQYRPRRPEEKKRRMTKAKRRKMMDMLLADEDAAKENSNVNTFEDNSDMTFLIPKQAAPQFNAFLAVDPAMTDIELTEGALDDAAREIDMMSWNAVVAQVDCMTKDFDLQNSRLQATGVTPGAYFLAK